MANVANIDLGICKAHANSQHEEASSWGPRNAKGRRTKTKQLQAKSMSRSVSTRASIFRNGANQIVRLPRELRFSEAVKEVRIQKQGDSLLISLLKPDWTSFFSIAIDVPEDFLESGDRLIR
jgi:virulence-associated protein VagC